MLFSMDPLIVGVGPNGLLKGDRYGLSEAYIRYYCSSLFYEL